MAAPQLGLGTGSLGGPDLAEEEARGLIEGARDLGIQLFDTARSYGEAEVRLGRHLARGPALTLCTKVGYGVDGLFDWSPDCVRVGIDQALARMRVSRLAVVYLHSCPVEVLRRGAVVDALAEAVEAGKVDRAGYSGDGEALDCAVGSGRFGAFQASFSLCDRNNRATLERARAAGAWVVLKRALANAPWRGAGVAAAAGAAPYDEAVEAGKVDRAGYSGDGEALDCAVGSGRFGAFQASFSLCDRNNRATLERARAAGAWVVLKRALANAPWRGAGVAAAAGAAPYDERWARMGLELGPEPAAVALRYAAFHGPGDAVLVGTRRLARLRAAQRALDAGPLPGPVVDRLEEAWRAAGGAGWGPVI